MKVSGAGDVIGAEIGTISLLSDTGSKVGLAMRTHSTDSKEWTLVGPWAHDKQQSVAHLNLQFDLGFVSLSISCYVLNGIKL